MVQLAGCRYMMLLLSSYFSFGKPTQKNNLIFISGIINEPVNSYILLVATNSCVAICDRIWEKVHSLHIQF